MNILASVRNWLARLRWSVRPRTVAQFQQQRKPPAGAAEYLLFCLRSNPPYLGETRVDTYLIDGCLWRYSSDSGQQLERWEPTHRWILNIRQILNGGPCIRSEYENFYPECNLQFTVEKSQPDLAEMQNEAKPS